MGDIIKMTIGAKPGAPRAPISPGMQRLAQRLLDNESQGIIMVGGAFVEIFDSGELTTLCDVLGNLDVTIDEDYDTVELRKAEKIYG